MRYHVGGFSGSIIPTIGVTISIPDALINSARGIALHNKIAKLAATVVMQHHHLNRMPGHFRQTNRNKYDHMERKKVTKRKKRRLYHSITDLVASGRSRDLMMAMFPTVRFSGNPAQVLRTFISYKWPFPVSREGGSNGVTVDQMSRELATWTNDELVQAIEMYRDTYVRLWEDEMAKRPKWRKKIKSGLAQA